MRSLRVGVCAFVALAAAMAATARGDLIATEDFESYTAGSQLHNGAGGTGWLSTSNWTVNTSLQTATTVVSKSLFYEKGSIEVSGGEKAMQLKLLADYTGNTVFASRQMDTTLSGPVYFSFLFQTTTADGPTDTDFFQVGMDTSATTPRVSVIHNKNSALSPVDQDFAARSSTGSDGTAQTYTGTGTEVGRTYFLVVKASKVNGSTNYNKVDLWVDPETLSEPPTAFESATSPTKDSGISQASFLILRLSALETNDTYYIDQFKVGDTFASVLPEPATLALTGLGLGAAAIVRGRKRGAA